MQARRERRAMRGEQVMDTLIARGTLWNRSSASRRHIARVAWHGKLAARQIGTLISLLSGSERLGWPAGTKQMPHCLPSLLSLCSIHFGSDFCVSLATRRRFRVPGNIEDLTQYARRSYVSGAGESLAKRLTGMPRSSR